MSRSPGMLGCFGRRLLRPLQVQARRVEIKGVEGAGPAVGQISCSLASTLLRLVRSRAGEEGVREVLDRAAVPHSASYLDDPSHWIWLNECIGLLTAAAEVLDDPEIGLHVGEQTVRQHAGTP